MRNILERYRPLYEGEGAGGGAGAGAGAGAGGAGAGAGAGGAGAGAGAGGAAEPFYKSWNLDGDSVKFIEDRKFDGPGTILKSAIESDRVARSRNVIEKPDPKALKDWKGFSELGWIEDATKYQVAKPTVAQGEVLHEGMFGAFAKASHAAKLAPWQAEQVYGEVFKAMNAEIAAENAKAAKASSDLKNGLRTEWGADFDVKEKLATRAFDTVAKKYGVGAADIAIIEKATGSAGLVKFFADFGELLGEDRLGGAGGGGGAGLPQTPEAVKAEIRKLHGDEDFVKVLNDPRHPRHADNVAQRQRLIDHLAKLERAA